MVIIQVIVPSFQSLIALQGIDCDLYVKTLNHRLQKLPFEAENEIEIFSTTNDKTPQPGPDPWLDVWLYYGWFKRFFERCENKIISSFSVLPFTILMLILSCWLKEDESLYDRSHLSLLGWGENGLCWQSLDDK